MGPSVDYSACQIGPVGRAGQQEVLARDYGVDEVLDHLEHLIGVGGHPAPRPSHPGQVEVDPPVSFSVAEDRLVAIEHHMMVDAEPMDGDYRDPVSDDHVVYVEAADGLEHGMKST